MRIEPVSASTGTPPAGPAVAVDGEPVPRRGPQLSTPSAPAERTSTRTGRPEEGPPAFDPPLIAQRAVLGWPVGPLVAAYALASRQLYAAADAQVAEATAALRGRPAG